MFRKRVIALALGLAAVGSLAVPALAVQEVECDSVYCFGTGDFSTSEADALTGICITDLPDSGTGTVMLGARVLQEGDILTAGQVEQMVFYPLRTEKDVQAVLSYLPIYENRVERTATMTLSVLGKEDKAPVAENDTLETYKNRPNEGKHKARDPEGQTLTFTLVRKPRRGSVELREDGTFVYTPKKNKVGVDSFTFTATDPAGKVSREATVTVQILKPSQSAQYSDTVGMDCRFEAEWLRNTGIFTGENIGSESCFHPEKPVSRGEFIALTVKALDIPLDNFDYTAIPAQLPNWLKPYLAAAIRSGLVEGWPDLETFEETVTGAEAAVMLQNALELEVSRQTLEQSIQQEAQVPVWAAVSLTAMSHNGIELSAEEPLTRADVACALYRAKYLADFAPGMAVFNAE